MSCLLLMLFVELSGELLEVGQGEKLLPTVDAEISAFVRGFESSWLTRFALGITELASFVFLSIFGILIIGVLVLYRQLRMALFFAISSVGGGVLTPTLKPFFQRERPDTLQRLTEAVGSSYPSGHSLGAASFYFSLIFLLFWLKRDHPTFRPLLVVILLLVLGVGWSRVYLGVHHPSDVAAGFLLGLAWCCLASALFLRHPNQQLPTKESDAT